MYQQIVEIAEWVFNIRSIFILGNSFFRTVVKNNNLQFRLSISPFNFTSGKEKHLIINVIYLSIEHGFSSYLTWKTITDRQRLGKQFPT
jgi:hypothetical protein